MTYCFFSLSLTSFIWSENILSEAKQPEHVFVSLFVEQNKNSPNDDADDSQAQSQSQSNDNTNTNTNANSQSQTIIICPETRDCVIQR